MSLSQKSFASVLGKFKDGLAVLKSFGDYDPAKPEIKIISLENFCAALELKNSNCITTADILKEFRNERRKISFRWNNSDINCVESLIVNILNYLKSEFGKEHPTVKSIALIIKKLRPVYNGKKKNSETEESGKAKSVSERSFQSLVGFSRDVYTLLTELGGIYLPQNTAITKENFKAKADKLEELNINVAAAYKNYIDAVTKREEMYYGEAGLTLITSSVKNYLASFEGGRKNARYTAFCNALK